MVILGIDPGIEGALAVLEDGQPPVVMPIPIVGGRRPFYDGPAFLRIVEISDHVFLERLDAMSGGKFAGSIANHRRGATRYLEGICVGRCPCELVLPRQWQKVMLAGSPGGDTKARAIGVAKRLYPAVSLRRTNRCSKDDDGIADALLIATYGKRRLEGRS